jgi:hypothetical protein
LEALRTNEFDMGRGDDDPSSTAVRHLRVEVQRDRTARVPPRGIGSRTRK